MDNRLLGMRVLICMALSFCYSSVLCQNNDAYFVVNPTGFPSKETETANFHGDIVDDAVFEKAFYLNDESDYLDLGNHRFLSDYSFSFWFSSDELLNHNASLLSIGEFLWLRATTKREIQFTQPNIQDQNTEGLALTEGVWYHLTLVVKDEVALIYVNGNQTASFKIKNPVNKLDAQIVFGKNKWREPFLGKFNTIHIWQQSLSSKEVKSHYKQAKSTVSLNKNLITYLPLDNKKTVNSSGENLIYTSINFITDSERKEVADFSTKTSSIDYGIIDVDNAITVSAWVKPSKKQINALISSGHAFAFKTDYKNQLMFTIPQVRDVYSGASKLEIGKWSHVAVTYHEKKAVKFFLNGKLLKTVPITENQLAKKTLRIGNNLWNETFQGQMDDVIVWSRILSDAEILEVSKMDASDLKPVLKIKKNTNYWLLCFAFIIVLVLVVFVYKHTLKSKVMIEVSNANDKSEFLIKAEEIVFNHLSDSSFGVEKFSEAMGMSKTSLYNNLKTEYDKSPKEFIRNERLMKASELLSATSKSIMEIIFETGFESRAYFYKCFKEKYNMTPSEFRKSKK